jgi:ferredoxin
MPPVPKPQHNRRQPKRAKRTAFSDKTRMEIYERDNGLCVHCFANGADIHHIEFRSSLTPDVSHKRNGCVLCLKCHSRAHQEREFREWLRGWKEKMLDENGDFIELPFSDWEGE